MATDNVLNLPELFENILLQLPTRDLLFAQKVCKIWKLTIDASPSVQKALFFAAGTVNDVLYSSPNHKSTAQCLADGQSTNHHEKAPAQEYNAYIEFATHEGYALNPLLTTCRKVGPDLRSDFRDSPWYSDADPTGSWSRMFVTQPPGSTLARAETIRIDDEMEDGWYPIENHATQCGERFGELVKQHRVFVGAFQREQGIGAYAVVNGRPWLVDARVPGPSGDKDENEDGG
ncbi:hypothetical protein LTR17_001701 [Elasticomyces elasticus]|nr:hypothetical protein LTR17_001701 [Elasticomyces elasticus]